MIIKNIYMKRKLLRQIAREWRSNVWLCIELMIVSVAVWFMVTSIYTIYRIANLPNGYQTDNTYMTTRKNAPEANDILKSMDPDEAANASVSQNELLLNAIAGMPGVESVAVGTNNMPYTYNFLGNQFRHADIDSIMLEGQGRYATPEMIDIMRWHPLAGASTAEELKAVFERGDIIITRSIGRAMLGLDEYGDGLEGAKELIGKQIVDPYSEDGSTRYTVGAVVEDMRRGRYEPAYKGSFLFPLRRNTAESVRRGNEIIIKVDPKRRGEFVDAFNAASANDKLVTQLYYIGELKYVDDIAAIHHASQDISTRNYIIIISFLLVSIFLGLLGTFWFRTAKRTSEIAIRMTTGATRGNICRRLFSEGVILVLVSTLPAAIIDWTIGWYIMRYPEAIGMLFSTWEFLFVGIAITLFLVMLMTIAGIWFPARRAMAVDPATALHEE